MLVRMAIKLARLNRSLPVRRQAADVVQDAIMRGQLRPGESLRQRTLALEFKLSHSAVREVLLELENRGLIAKKGSTYAVSHLSEDEYNDLVAMRLLLEPVACRFTAEHWRAQAGAELEACLDRMRKAVDGRDFAGCWQCDRDFHRIIWKHQPNRVLEAHLDRICTQLFAFYLSQSYADTYTPQGPRDRVLLEHRLILDVLRSSDGARAERMVRRVLERSSRRASAILRRIWAAPARRASL
jgi:DNA-binding GntR family transcriptional regulator